MSASASLGPNQVEIESKGAVAEFNSLVPQISFSFKVRNVCATDNKREIMLEPAKCDFYQRASSMHEFSSNVVFLGSGRPSKHLLKIAPNEGKDLKVNLKLDNYTLKQIERMREGRDLFLIFNFSFVAQIVNTSEMDELDLNAEITDPIKISKSDWVENMLVQFKFKDTFLLEFPKLPGGEFSEISGYINNASRQYHIGEYDKVLVECRKALEASAKKVKDMGFEAQSNDGKEKKIPDWPELFGKRRGDIIKGLLPQILSFLAPGAHAGKAINREEADFALLNTYALVNLIIKKLPNQ